MRCQLELAKEDDSLVRPEDVVEKRLVEPDRSQRPRAIAHDQLEDLEARQTRRANAAAHDFSEDRGRDAWPQFGDGCEGAAVFVADRKSVEQVFDRVQAHPLEVRRPPRPDPFEELQRRLQRIYCTTIP